MKLIRLLIWGLFSGLLLGFSWPYIGFPALIFIAWFPLLLAESLIVPYFGKASAGKAYLISYVAFVVWNLLDTWWIKNAEADPTAGLVIMLLANLANAALMAGVFSLAHVLRQRIPSKRTIWIFPIFWIAFEYLHHDWDLSWPWLTLGNVFATSTPWIQWYEFTGVFGGSLWVWAANIFVFNWLQARLANQTKVMKQSLFVSLAVLLLPIAVSFLILKNKKLTGTLVEIVVVQPNIDPFNDKFSKKSAVEQIEEYNRLALPLISDATQLVFGPETALPFSLNETELSNHPHVQQLDTILKKSKQMAILTGMSSHRFFQKGDSIPSIARKLNQSDDVYYLSYNSALFLQNDKKPEVYHKSKLVPGVEQMPFPSIFKFVEDFAINLGGTSGTLGKQDERTVFNTSNGLIKVAPSVCYESIYSEFTRKYIGEGANLIGVITNDGWWGETPGYKQHAAYARIRAVELRRSVVRAANTGISCTINPLGEVTNETAWWVPAAFKAKVLLNNEVTFFARYGSIVGVSAVCLSAVFLIFNFIIFIRLKLNKPSKKA